MQDTTKPLRLLDSSLSVAFLGNFPFLTAQPDFRGCNPMGLTDACREPEPSSGSQRGAH